MSSIKPILYTQKKLSGGKHPVMLYIYQDKAYRMSLGYSCKPKQWDKANAKFKSSMPNHHEKNFILRQQELKANEIIDGFTREGKWFSIEEFKTEFKGTRNVKTFYEFFQELIDEKKTLGKAGNMLIYHAALKACKRYKPKDLNFMEVNYTYLKGIETLHLQRGCKGGGVSVYMRTIRAVYYEGVKRGYIDPKYNPFSTVVNRNGYSLANLKSQKNPKALSKEEIIKFKNFDYLKYPELADSWRMFMFSFYVFGMNFADICELTKNSIQNDRLVYIRKKTNKTFTLKLNEKTYRIIEYFATSDKYLFPVYKTGVHETPLQKKYRSNKVRKKVNDDLKHIAKILDIQSPVTFYYARHSSATTLKRNGVENAIISEALGHSNAEVTTHYLKSFENEVLDLAMDSL